MNRSVVSIAVSGGVFLGIAPCIHDVIPPRGLSASCTALFANKTIRNQAASCATLMDHYVAANVHFVQIAQHVQHVAYHL